MKNEFKHLVICEGKAHTRRSARIYTHVIVGRVDIARLRELSKEITVTAQHNARYFAEVVAGTHHQANSPASDSGFKNYQEQCIAAGYTTDIAHNLAKTQREDIARLEDQIQRGLGALVPLTWSQTEHNVMKAFQTYRRNPYYKDIAIRPVEQRVPSGEPFTPVMEA